ncbi:MAG TPA: YceI family protein [Oscillatoriaceae cyanobacterium]
MKAIALATAALLFATPALAATTEYSFGNDSTITYYVTHPLHHVEGVTHTLAGKISVEDGRLVGPATLSLPFVSFNSGNGNRDNTADYLIDIAHFPLVTLTIDKFDAASTDKAGDGLRETGTAVGTLSIHGVRQPVTVPLTVTTSAINLVADGDLTVSLTQFHISRPSLLFMPISDTVKVHVHAIAKRAS